VRRRPRVVVAVALAVATVLAGVTGWVVLASPLLVVRTVEVNGTSRLTEPEVAAAADVPGSTPLARLDTEAVAARVRALPAVRSVVVDRSWPGTVRIDVTERRAAAVRRQDGAFRLLDRSGVAFATVPRRPAGLPLVSGVAGARPEALAAALDVLTSVPPPVRRQLVEVRAVSPEQVTLRLTRGRTVVWGSPERGERKAAVLSALLPRRAVVYDVSAPDAPTTRRR
jgi:cell division protein FtsQ